MAIQSQALVGWGVSVFVKFNFLQFFNSPNVVSPGIAFNKNIKLEIIDEV